MGKRNRAKSTFETITESDVRIALKMMVDYLYDLMTHLHDLIGDEPEVWKGKPTHLEMEVDTRDCGSIDALCSYLNRLQGRFKLEDPSALEAASAALKHFLSELEASSADKELTGVIKFAWNANIEFVTKVIEALEAGKVVDDFPLKAKRDKGKTKAD